MLRNPTKPAGHGVCRIRIHRETSRLKWWFCQPPKCIRVVLGNTVKSTGRVRWDICSMRPRNTFVQYRHTPAMQAFPHWGTSRPEHPSCGDKSGCSIVHCKPIGWIGLSYWLWQWTYQMERCSGRLHWHWQSWILCWQSFRARCLDGFIDIGRFNFRFSTSSSQSPFYLQAAESAFVTYCESMWRTKGSPCPFRIEMTRTGERRKKEDMMVASQTEDPKLYVAHSRSQQHRLKI